MGRVNKNKDIIKAIALVATIVSGAIFMSFAILKPKKIKEIVSSSPYLFGIDVSHYQGHINWDKVSRGKRSIHYAIIRSTMGRDGKDLTFQYNWKEAKRHRIIRGAYHYYRPNENSFEQFNNFASTVVLRNGDLPPVLDVEEMSIYGVDNLRRGVLNWLRLAEQHYGVKPIIYTGRSFYDHYLKGYIDDYPLWIAAYSGKHRVNDMNWVFHQFTEWVYVEGITTNVDGNDFNGTREDLERLVVRY